MINVAKWLLALNSFIQKTLLIFQLQVAWLFMLYPLFYHHQVYKQVLLIVYLKLQRPTDLNNCQKEICFVTQLSEVSARVPNAIFQKDALPYLLQCLD